MDDFYRSKQPKKLTERQQLKAIRKSKSEKLVCRYCGSDDLAVGLQQVVPRKARERSTGADAETRAVMVVVMESRTRKCPSAQARARNEDVDDLEAGAEPAHLSRRRDRLSNSRSPLKGTTY
jgi:hypothetical protein